MSEYHSDKFMVYHPIADVQRILGMKKKTDIFLDDYKVKLRKRGDNTLVQIEVSDDAFFGDIIEGIAQVRSYLYNYLTDKEAIERVLEVLSAVPEDEYFQDVLSDLQRGEPLSYKIDEILSNIEDKRENLDPQILNLIEDAKQKSPRSKFVKSLEERFKGGFDLSERQIEVLENIANPPVKPVNQAQLDLVDKALSISPRSRFLKSLKADVEMGRTLSQKQLDVINNILTPQAASPSSSDPQTMLLQDLLANGKYLNRDDYSAIRSALKGGQLDDEQRKRLRHLVYKNTNRLDNSYSRDHIRKVLKKSSIQRVASIHLRRISMS